MAEILNARAARALEAADAVAGADDIAIDPVVSVRLRAMVELERLVATPRLRRGDAAPYLVECITAHLPTSRTIGCIRCSIAPMPTSRWMARVLALVGSELIHVSERAADEEDVLELRVCIERQGPDVMMAIQARGGSRLIALDTSALEAMARADRIAKSVGGQVGRGVLDGNTMAYALLPFRRARRRPRV